MLLIKSASKKDYIEIESFFQHYKINELIKNRLNFNTIIAQEDNKIVGLIQWIVKEDPNQGVVELEELFVNPDFRSQGIGKKLVEKVLEIIKTFYIDNNLTLRKVILYVKEDNKQARAIYEKFGFKENSNIGYLFSNDSKDLLYVLNI
ncbi:GNAT family N-acetyltransferase [Patescibacteria group bacterium]|nr:GNAT family N-acetyltransferase [Patescibacteria group bacterium]MBU4022769.1 GNAT family N-acetyltransferase [Patescibacteria group bacterium]